MADWLSSFLRHKARIASESRGGEATGTCDGAAEVSDAVLNEGSTADAYFLEYLKKYLSV